MSTKRARTDLGRFVRRRREALGLVQRDVAERAGLRNSSVTRIERGDVPNPRPDTLQRLAVALDVSFEDLFVRIGYTDGTRLPAPGPYLRAKYRHLPDAALKEAERFFADLEDRHQRASRGKRAG